MSQFQSFLFEVGPQNDPNVSSFPQLNRETGENNNNNNLNKSIESLSHNNALISAPPTRGSGLFQSGLLSQFHDIPVYNSSKLILSMSIHDMASSPENVLIDLNQVKSLKEGDYAILYKKGSEDDEHHLKDSAKRQRKLIFQVRGMDTNFSIKTGSKYQISILNDSLLVHLNLKKSSQLVVKMIQPENYEIDLIEIYIKDIYLSRGDMWVISNYIVDNYSYCFVGQTLNAFKSINVTVSKIHIGTLNSYSGIINKNKTKIIFRSKSSKLTFMIQLSSDMFHFDVTGAMIHNKIINSLFPAIFQNWLDMGTNHLITVILFTSIVDDDDPQLTNCKLGETFKNAKDYYRIVVDQININHWSKIMINLRYEILRFKQDIQLINKQLLPSLKGNIIQALNLSTILMLNNVNNLTSLRHTQNHFILISPGQGLFDVDLIMFKKIVKKILRLDISIDLVCLGTKPIHYSPLFRYRDLHDKLLYRFPVWFNCYFWMHNRFINSFNLINQADTNSYIKQLTQHTHNSSELAEEENDYAYNAIQCKFYELQMMGVMEYEMSGLEVPYLSNDVDSSNKYMETIIDNDKRFDEKSPVYRFVKEYMEKYDSHLYTYNNIEVSEEGVDEMVSKLGEVLNEDSGKLKSKLTLASNKEKLKNLNSHLSNDKENEEIAQNKASENDTCNVNTINNILESKKLIHSLTNNQKQKEHKLFSTPSSLFNLSKCAATEPSISKGPVTEVPKRLDGSAYSSLKAGQKKMLLDSSANPTSSYASTVINNFNEDSFPVLSDVSNVNRPSVLNSKDDLTLRKQRTNASLKSVSSKFQLNDSASPVKSTSAFRSLSEKIFSVLGGQDKSNTSSYQVSAANTATSPNTTITESTDIITEASSIKTHDGHSITSKQVSSRKSKKKNRNASRYYRSAPFKSNKTSASSMNNSLNQLEMEKKKREQSIKYNRELYKADPEYFINTSEDQSKKAVLSEIKFPWVEKGKRPTSQTITDEDYLGLVVKKPLKLSDLDLRFSSINFGKWSNTYPVPFRPVSCNDNSSINKSVNRTKFGNKNSLQWVKNGSLVYTSNVMDSNKKIKEEEKKLAPKNLISWRSLICPASLPTTSNEFPTFKEIKEKYTSSTYEILTNSKFKDLISPSDLFKEMIYVRLMMGFQIADATSNPLILEYELKESRQGLGVDDMINYYMPKNYEEKKNFYPIAYLVLLDEIHRLFLDSYGNTRVQIFRKFNDEDYSEDTKKSHYTPFVRTRYDKGYRQVEFNQSNYEIMKVDWNKIDYYLAGNFDGKYADYLFDENDKINVFQIRLVVIKNSNSEKNSKRFTNASDVISEQSNINDSTSFNSFGSYSKHVENVCNFLKFIQKDEFRGFNGELEHYSKDHLDYKKMRPLLIDIDPNGKSHKAEILKIYHDDIEEIQKTGINYENSCFHLKIQWLTTTPKFIDDLITRWSHNCEAHDLKLIEVPVYEAFKTPKINPFHSFVNIKWVFDPWDFPDEYFNDNDHPINKFYYHKYLLESCDFHLDGGNEKFFNDSNSLTESIHLIDKQDDDNITIINANDFNKVSTEADFKFIQYIHKSGAYLAEIKENGEFFLAPNNIFIARINLRKQALRKQQRDQSSRNINNKYGDFSFHESYSTMTNHDYYNTEKDYNEDYTNYQSNNKGNDEDDLFFDSQTIMMNFLEKCNDEEYLKKSFQEAKSLISNRKEYDLSADRINDSSSGYKGLSLESNLQEISVKYGTAGDHSLNDIGSSYNTE